MSERRIIKFKAGYWYHEFLENENRAVIHIGGRTQKNETVHVIVENFEPTIYLELPTRVAWDRTKCKVLFEWLKKTMVDKNGVKYGPVDHSLTQKYIIHYKKLVYCISLVFPSENAAKRLPSKMNYYRGFHVPGIGNFQKEEFKVHEHNIDAVIKLTAERGITLSSWIKVKEMIHVEDESLSVKDRKFSSADIDAYVNWKDLSCTETESGNTYVPPKYISFDIECYSKNHNSKMPNPDIPENVVNQIALTIGTLGDKNRKRIILTLGNPDFVENSDEIRRHGYCESELLLDFKDQVLLYDPDIYLGYNTTKFDWGYLITRAKLCEVFDEFSLLSRIYEKQAEIRVGGWSSSAYGEQKFSYLECHGRTNVDLLIEVERNFRLPNYRLETVSNHFKIGGKDDLSARALFMIWQMTLEILPKIDGKELTLVEYSKIKSRIAQIFPIRQCHGLIRQYRKKLLKSTREKMCATIKEGMSLMGKYCIQDTVLVVDLAEKLNVWTTMEEMSNVTNVPASYLHTRGQQIKVLAQVYRETRKNGMIIPFNKKSGGKEKFQGAMVVEANPGEYELVPTLDFASLYPSIIMAFNICHTTILDDKDPTPDSECHVIIFSDHVGCIVIGTPISLSNRSEYIETLDLGTKDRIYGLNNYGVSLFDQTGYFEQGFKDCIRLTFEDGTTLECTPDHKIYTSDGKWLEAKDIEYGTCVKMTYRPPIFNTDEYYKFKFAGETYYGSRLVKLMQLFGLLMSDGYVTKGRCRIYLGHKLDCSNIESDLLGLFGINAKPREENYGWSYLIPDKYGIAFRELPGVQKGNRHNQVRTFPEFIMQPNFPKVYVRAFLSGLFGGDGHTLTYSPKARSLGSIFISWSSDDLNNLSPIFSDISLLLDRVGLRSSITTCGKEMKLGIPTEDILKFHEKIGFAHCVHKAMRLEAGCLYLRHRHNVWNQQKMIVQECKNLRDNDKIKKGCLDRALKSALDKNKDRPVFNHYYANPTKDQMIRLLNPRRKHEKPMFSSEHFPGPMEYMEKIGARQLFATDGVVTYGVHEDSEELPTFNVPLIYRESIGQRMTFDLEIDESHTFIASGVLVHNCEHDPQKRKRKAADILCRDHRYRFRKVKYIIQADGTVLREHEGVLPRLERLMMAVRKAYKKDMAKAEAIVKMNSGKAPPDEIVLYKKWGYNIIGEGSLSDHDAKMAEVDFGVFNAKQLAVKISMNSMYGCLGVENGFLPLVKGAASVTAMGRMLITMAIAYIRKIYPFVKLVYGDSVSADTPILCKYNGHIVYTRISELPSIGTEIIENGKEYFMPPDGFYVWSDTGFTLIKKIIRHKTTKKMYRVYTSTGVVDVTEDHSLLDKHANKIKPTEIDVGCELLHTNLPIPYNIRTDLWKSFFEYVSNVEDPKEFTIICEDKLKCANMYLIGSIIGYTVFVAPSYKNNTYSLSFNKANDVLAHHSNNNPYFHKTPSSIANDVTHIEELSPTDDYVYDLETDNHHFSAGIGRMVVHNTDSCMIHFEGKNLDEHFALIAEASSKTTHHLKCHIINIPDEYTVGVEKKPIASVKSTDAYFRTLTHEEQCHVLDYETSPINLEFENMYGWFLLLTKKRYMADKLNKKGEFIGETLKGNVLTRRDNCKYLRDTYKLLKDRHCNEEECIRILCDRIQLLFTRYVVGGIPDTDLIIYMGIKTLMNYAKTKKIEGKEDAKAFIDANKDFIDDPIGPLDPRLVYPNIPQVLLALKMTRRGEEIPPNTRLEFLYLRNPQAQHQGEKAEDYTYYKENGKDEGLRPDEMHYIEKQLAKPITELFNVRFPKPIIPYISLEEQLLKHVDKLNDLQRFRIANTKTYVKIRPISQKNSKDAKEFIGWDVLRKEGCKIKPLKGLANDLQFTEYKFVKDDAKVACMMDQLKYHSKSNDISQKEYPELLGFCTLWKSMEVIDTKYKQYGLTRRKWRKPTYVGPKIRTGSNVVTVIKCGDILEGSVCRIIARSDIPLGKKLFSYTYDLIDTKTEIIEKDVARNVFTTYIVQNDNMMKNILLYRECYAEVVDHLNKLFSGDIAISFCSESESIKK